MLPLSAKIKVPVESWEEYGQREQTRREHLVELQTVFGFKSFNMSHYRQTAPLSTCSQNPQYGLNKLATSRFTANTNTCNLF